MITSQEVAFQKLILNIIKNYTNRTNDYPKVPDKLKIEREMWLDYQLKIADVYNTYIGNVKKLVLSFFYKEEYGHH